MLIVGTGSELSGCGMHVAILGASHNPERFALQSVNDAARAHHNVS